MQSFPAWLTRFSSRSLRAKRLSASPAEVILSDRMFPLSAMNHIWPVTQTPSFPLPDTLHALTPRKPQSHPPHMRVSPGSRRTRLLSVPLACCLWSSAALLVDVCLHTLPACNYPSLYYVAYPLLKTTDVLCDVLSPVLVPLPFPHYDLQCNHHHVLWCDVGFSPANDKALTLLG